jgi:hypothetical protein
MASGFRVYLALWDDVLGSVSEALRGPLLRSGQICRLLPGTLPLARLMGYLVLLHPMS